MGGLPVIVIFVASMIPAAISVVACIVFAGRTRSRVSYALAVGATGGLVATVASRLFGIFVLPGLLVSRGFERTINLVDSVETGVELVFALLFSVALFFLLRGLRRGPAVAEAAGLTAAQDAGLPSDQATGTPPAGTPAEELREARPTRSVAGFAWGLALGIVAMLILGGGGVLATRILIANASSGSDMLPRIVVSPTKAGTQWFRLSAEGTGTMQAWSSGESGDAGGGGENPTPAGAVLFFDVGAGDTADGIAIQHVVRVYLTRRTVLVIGGKPFAKGTAASPAEAAFKDGDPFYDYQLTIDFHRVGNSIVADRIVKAAKASVTPLLQ